MIGLLLILEGGVVSLSMYIMFFQFYLCAVTKPVCRNMSALVSFTCTNKHLYLDVDMELPASLILFPGRVYLDDSSLKGMGLFSLNMSDTLLIPLIS